MSALPMTIAGANHGGRGALPYLVRLGNDAERTNITIITVDPVPGRAQALAATANTLGIEAVGREEKIENVINDLPDGAFVVLNVDNPAAHARALELLSERRIGCVGYGFLKEPRGQLFAFRYVHSAEDYEAKRREATFFRGIERFTARGGRERIFGARGRPEHVAMEEIHRAWFGEHLNENARKYTAGIPSNHYHLELTSDGTRTLPVFVQESHLEWAEPSTLTQTVLLDPPEPVMRGDEFVVAEVHEEGVRLHFARLRRTDGRLSIGGYAAFDATTLDALEAAERERALAAERERLQREAETALQRAEQQTVTRRAPFFMTD